MAKRKNAFRQWTDFGFLSSEIIMRNLAFVLFLGFLATIYIANAHYAERNVRRIQLLQKELKEQRWYYMSLEAENMYNSRRSEVLSRVRAEGLGAFEEKPRIIVVDK